MPSMSYCIVENMLGDATTLCEVVEALINEGDAINQYEQQAFKALFDTFRELLRQIDEAIEDGIIDENGKLLDSDDEEID